MKKVQSSVTRPDVDAAIRGGDWSQAMDGEGIPEDATALIEIEGEPLPPIPARVRLRNGFWIATAGLPRWTTPRKVVSLLGHGATREAALKDLTRLANKRLAYDKESREIERLRLASEP